MNQILQVGPIGGGLGMQGTSVIIGTRYAWNIDNKGDQVCLERWSNLGPGMCGTLVKIGTGYAWNVSHIGDQTCLERFSMGTRHAWNV